MQNNSTVLKPMLKDNKKEKEKKNIVIVPFQIEVDSTGSSGFIAWIRMFFLYVFYFTYDFPNLFRTMFFFKLC